MRESFPSAPVCNACCFARDPCSSEPMSKDPACFCWKDLQLLLSYAGQKRKKKREKKNPKTVMTK